MITRPMPEQITTIKRVGKREFEKAFNNGERVAIVKDQHYWKFYDNAIGSTHEVPGPVGFTNERLTIEDIYADGPSRPGEAFRYWIVVTQTARVVQKKEELNA